MAREIPQGKPIKFIWVDGTKNFTAGECGPLDINDDGSPKQDNKGKILSDRMKAFVEEMTLITEGSATGEFTREQYRDKPKYKTYSIDAGSLKHAIEYGVVEAVKKDGKGTWNGRTAIFRLIRI